jgi:antitoxin HicB
MDTKKERKPLKYYYGLKYPVILHPAPEGGYAVEIEELPGCFSQGETVEEAMKMIEEARRLWIESVYEDGNDIPLPRDEDEYSGKFNVRLPKSLHKKLDGLAVHEGVSLNQYLVATLSHAVGLVEGRKAKPRSRKRKQP